MPTVRKVPLVTGEIYHVFNRGIDKRTVFSDFNEYLRAFQSIRYYQFEHPPMKISEYLRSSPQFRLELEKSDKGVKLATIYCYCLMPNHFHLLLKQEADNGISRYLGRFLNSYTRYFNTKHKRVGGLFLDQFKNVLVKSDSQLLHLSRYIHLNPYSSGVVKNLDELSDYMRSSLREYLGVSSENICSKDLIMVNYKNISQYKDFVYDRAEYQKELKELEME